MTELPYDIFEHGSGRRVDGSRLVRLIRASWLACIALGFGLGFLVCGLLHG